MASMLRLRLVSYPSVTVTPFSLHRHHNPNGWRSPQVPPRLVDLDLRWSSVLFPRVWDTAIPPQRFSQQQVCIKTSCDFQLHFNMDSSSAGATSYWSSRWIQMRCVKWVHVNECVLSHTLAPKYNSCRLQMAMVCIHFTSYREASMNKNGVSKVMLQLYNAIC